MGNHYKEGESNEEKSVQVVQSDREPPQPFIYNGKTAD
jgi:hypothetical protein